MSVVFRIIFSTECPDTAGGTRDVDEGLGNLRGLAHTPIKKKKKTILHGSSLTIVQFIYFYKNFLCKSVENSFKFHEVSATT